MDAPCNEVKKPEGSDPAVDARPPPAKLARLEQNEAGPSAQERSRQGSPVATIPCVAQKPTTVRPQSKSCHSRGTWPDEIQKIVFFFWLKNLSLLCAHFVTHHKVSCYIT